MYVRLDVHKRVCYGTLTDADQRSSSISSSRKKRKSSSSPSSRLSFLCFLSIPAAPHRKTKNIAAVINAIIASILSHLFHLPFMFINGSPFQGLQGYFSVLHTTSNVKLFKKRGMRCLDFGLKL